MPFTFTQTQLEQIETLAQQPENGQWGRYWNFTQGYRNFGGREERCRPTKIPVTVPLWIQWLMVGGPRKLLGKGFLRIFNVLHRN